jgi:hypothetical protein
MPAGFCFLSAATLDKDSDEYFINWPEFQIMHPVVNVPLTL